MKTRLSYSSIATYQECRRKYKFQKIERVYPRKRASYFVFGEAMHAFLEAHYSGLPDPVAASGRVFEKVDKAPLSPQDLHSLAVDRAIVTGIAKSYPKFFSQDKHQFAKVVTEKEFTLSFPNFDYLGYIDMLVQDPAGAWWVFETKTAAAQTLSADYIDRVKIDAQVTSYLAGARQILGVMPAGVIYNMIKKPSIRLKKGETLGAFTGRIANEYSKFATEKGYFTREQLLISPKQVSRWEKEVDYIGSEIAAAERYPRTTGACIGKFGSCPYLEACVTGKINPLMYVKSEK